MLNRNVAILIASGLLNVQVNLAVAEQGTFPSSAQERPSNLSPAQIKYLEQRSAEIQKEPVTREPVRGLPGVFYSPSGLSVPGIAGQGTLTGGFAPSRSPALSKYLAEREAEVKKEGRVLNGDSFPHSAGGG